MTSILKPDRRKIVYRRNWKSHRFLPDNKINVYSDAHRHWFDWMTGYSGNKAYRYPTKIPAERFRKMLEKDFGDRVSVVVRSGHMQLSFENDTDYVMFGIKYLS